MRIRGTIAVPMLLAVLAGCGGSHSSMPRMAPSATTAAPTARAVPDHGALVDSLNAMCQQANARIKPLTAAAMQALDDDNAAGAARKFAQVVGVFDHVVMPALTRLRPPPEDRSAVASIRSIVATRRAMTNDLMTALLDPNIEQETGRLNRLGKAATQQNARMKSITRKLGARDCGR